MPIADALYSSKSGEWGTPESFMAVLRHMFGGFDLDVAASVVNAKAPTFLSLETDGLNHPWWGSVYCNPPYGREVGNWLLKAETEVVEGRANQVVMLVPARTDTKWWHRYAMTANQIYLVRGRLTFEGAPSAAPFPSAVIRWVQNGPPLGVLGMERKVATT